MNDDIEQLKKRVQELEDWKTKKEGKQLSYPLDQDTVDTVNQYFPRIIDNVILTYTGASAHYVPVLLGKQGDQRFDLSNTYVRYTADPSTNVITIVDKTKTNQFADDQQVVFYVDLLTGDTAPGGITDSSVTYYVVSTASDGYSFKVSASSGGVAVDITSAGTGKQFITKL
jgi:hypothetical protein